MAKKDDKDEDKKGKAKAEVDPESIAVGDVKQVMMTARQSGHAIPFAIALTRGKEALLVVDRKMKPKKLRKAIKDQCEDQDLDFDATSLRFGRAQIVDKCVTFRINKDPPGALRMPLLSRVKTSGAGCNEIAFVLDVDLEAEPDDDVPEMPHPPQPAGTAGTAPGAAPAVTPPEQEPAAPGPDMAALEARLGQLAGRLKQLFVQLPDLTTAVPELKGNLIGLADVANKAAKTAAAASDAHTKAGAVDDAEIAIDALDEQVKEAALQVTTHQTGGGKGGPDAKVVADKAQQVWSACFELASREVEKLRAEVTSAYRDHGFGAEVEKFFKTQIDPALKKLEARDLTNKLSAASKTADAAERRQLLNEGMTILTSLEQTIASDPVLKKLDDNPFTKLVIAKTASATLGKLKQSLQTAVNV